MMTRLPNRLRVLLTPLIALVLCGVTVADAQTNVYEFASLSVADADNSARWTTDYITITAPSVHRLVFTLSERGGDSGYPPGFRILSDRLDEATATTYLLSYLNTLGWELLSDNARADRLLFRRLVDGPLAVQAIKP